MNGIIIGNKKPHTTLGPVTVKATYEANFHHTARGNSNKRIWIKFSPSKNRTQFSLGKFTEKSNGNCKWSSAQASLFFSYSPDKPQLF